MMARAQEHNGQKRVRWSKDEDHRLRECMMLVQYLKECGKTVSLKDVLRRAGLMRDLKSCKLRWNNYLRPGLERGPFSKEEEATIIKFQKQRGNKWTTLARQMPRRTDTDIKNFWNSREKKLLKKNPRVCTRNPDGIGYRHSDASFNRRHGHGFHPTDEELLPPLTPQTPSFNYQQAMGNIEIEIPNPSSTSSIPEAIREIDEFLLNDEIDNSFPKDQVQDKMAYLRGEPLPMNTPPISASPKSSMANDPDHPTQEMPNPYSGTFTTFEAWTTYGQ